MFVEPGLLFDQMAEVPVKFQFGKYLDTQLQVKVSTKSGYLQRQIRLRLQFCPYSYCVENLSRIFWFRCG